MNIPRDKKQTEKINAIISFEQKSKPLKNPKNGNDTLITPNEEENNFLHIIHLPILVAQLCGLFPVSGIRKDSVDDLKFKWVSFSTLYSVFCIAGTLCMAVFFFYWISVRGLRLENLGSLVFYSASLICTIFFFKLAKVWPSVAKHWVQIEKKFAAYPSVKNSPRKYKYILGIILGLAFIEHTLAVAISFGWLSKCTFENLGIAHIKADFPQWFCFIEYNHVKAILVEYFNWMSTFYWNYTDIFIILISEILTEKFNQINQKIEFGQVKVINNEFYKIIREDYTQLAFLCKKLNDALCNIVSLSFLTNIMHICIQLYNILRTRETLVEYFYFYFSLGFLISRAVLVSVFASAIYDTSKIPLYLLNFIPSFCYNVEVSRFIMQVYTSSITLTCSNFVPVTRNLLISVTGTVIAYEIVLLQLPRPQSKADKFLLNATEPQKIAFICNVTRFCEP